MYSPLLGDAPAIREPRHAPVAHVVRGGVIEESTTAPSSSWAAGAASG